MATLSFPALLALTFTLDVVILTSGLPLARYTLQTEQGASIALLLGLLAANLLLLGVVLFAFYVNGAVLHRVAIRSSELRHNRRGSGKDGSRLCDTSAGSSSKSAPPTS